MYSQVLTFGAAFLGSAVESVEALTIVLAVGLTRGWRSPLYGALVALIALAVLVLLFGQLIVTRVPELTLKLIIGTLIVLFGLRWLHKAILRSAGVIAMHDENKSYEETVKELHGSPLRQDWVAFVIALKTRPTACSESTPSASRAPPECQMPTIGRLFFIAVA